MVCSQCGCEQMGGAQFCRQCGMQFGLGHTRPPAGAAPYLPEQRMRVSENLQPLGIMWCLFGVYRLARAIVAATVLGAMAHGERSIFRDAPDFVPHLFSMLVPVIAVLAGVMALLSFLTGYGLLTRQAWGRTLAIVMGILTLIKLPVGTALGIYTLWVLAPSASGLEWQRVQRAAV